MRNAVLFTAAALLVACTKPKPANEPAAPGASEAPASGSAPGAGGKLDFDSLSKREATGLSEQKVTGPGKMFTATVMAVAAPKVALVDKIAVVEIPIGTGEPIRCQVFSEAVDAGGTIGQVIANAAKKVEIARVAPWAIEVVKEVPMTFVHAIYTMQTPRGKAAGEIKLAAQAPTEHAVVCVHDEFGYEQTFLDGAKKFCDSLEFSEKAAAPAYVEVQVAKLKGAPVGFSKTTIVVDGAKRHYVDTTTLLLPVSPSELRVEDDYSIENVDADLRLESGVWVSASGDHIELNVQAKRTKGGSYHYAGEMQGKKVEGDFKTKDAKGLPTAVSLVRDLAAKGKAAAFSFDAPSYHPGLDPTKPMTTRYFREKGDPEFSIREKVGDTVLTGVLDEVGVMKKGEMPIGGMSLTFERLFVRGKF